MTVIIFFEVTYYGLMSFLALAIGGVGAIDINNKLNTIFAPFPDPGQQPGSFGNCVWYNLACQANNAATATAYIGWAILYAGSLAFAFISRIPAFGGLFFSLTQLPSTLGIPFVGFMMLGFQIIVVMYGVTIIRGNFTGG